MDVSAHQLPAPVASPAVAVRRAPPPARPGQHDRAAPAHRSAQGSRQRPDDRRPSPGRIADSRTAPEIPRERRASADLDGDGRIEHVPLLYGGDGIVVVDRDGNGHVDAGVAVLRAPGASTPVTPEQAAAHYAAYGS